MSANDAKPPAGVAPGILEAALARPPDDAEESWLDCDAYALWAAMTRLGHEVKLQGRAFAALRERLENDAAPNAEAAIGGIGEKVAVLAERALARARENDREADRRIEAARRQAAKAEDDLLSTLADLHDRMSRGLDAARRRKSGEPPKKGWLARMLPRADNGSEMVDSLVEGQELALGRLGDELARRAMRPIAALGERFNPETMRAVAADASGQAEDGTVTMVVRGGWLRGEAVWRAAEVAVARSRQQEGLS